MPIVETMPTMFGEQLYPMGFPMKPEDISYNGKTIRALWFEFVDGDKTSESILCDYIAYHVFAPCFMMDMEMREKFKPENTYEEMYDLCFEIGLDPF